MYIYNRLSHGQKIINKMNLIPKMQNQNPKDLLVILQNQTKPFFKLNKRCFLKLLWFVDFFLKIDYLMCCF